MVKINPNSVVGVALRQGREEGRLLALQSVLQKLLTVKFGSLPPNVLEEINKCQKLGRLEEAATMVYQLGSLNDLVL